MSMVEDILDFSKIQFGRFELSCSWFSFHDLVNDAINMCRFQASARGLQLKTYFNFDETIELNSDSKRIKQIIINLITNAIKFTY